MPVLCDDDVGLAGTLAREATLPSVEQEDAVGRPMKQAASVDVAQCRAPVLSGFAEPCHRDDRDLDLSGQGLEAAGDGATRFPGSGSAKIGANSFRPSMLLRRTSFAGKDLRRAQVREARGFESPRLHQTNRPILRSIRERFGLLRFQGVVATRRGAL